MNKEQSAYHPKDMAEIVGAAVNESQHQDDVTSIVKRLVSQCGALLRQQLERKAKQEPLVYDEGRIGRIMRDFEASTADVEAIIAERVMNKVTVHVQQEVLRVLNDALDEGEEILEDPALAPRANTELPPANGKSPRRAAERRPAVEEPTSREYRRAVEESTNGREAIELPPVEPLIASETREQGLPTEDAQPVVAAPPEEPEKQEIHETLKPQEVPERATSESNEEIYEGTVKLRVEANECLRQVVQFVDALRRNSEFRLLQLVGDYKEGVGIWLGLRSPLRLREVLLEMDGVSQVDAARKRGKNGHEPQLNVQLKEAALTN